MYCFPRKKSYFIVFLAILLVAGLAGGCKPKPATAAATTAGQTSTDTAVSPSTADGSTSAVTAETTGGETTTASTSGETTAAGSETSTELTSAAEPGIYYRVLPANQVNLADLNDDGKSESITYSCLDDFSFNLTLNGVTERQEGESFLSGWFFLADLDSGDRFIDIAVQELGPVNDDQVTFFYFDGSRLIRRGTVPGTICDPDSGSIEKDPFGLGSVQLDGLGGLVAHGRGLVLHTWFYDEPWLIGGDHLLVKISQIYFPMQGYDQVTGAKLAETPVKMKMDLPLAVQPGSSEAAAIARSGQSASLVQTDNAEWVQLRTETGVLGWFQLKDYYMVLINDQPFFSDDVFEGLNLVD